MKSIICVLSLLCFNLYAQNVISYTGNQKDLAARWDWAIEQASKDGNDSYWIIYTFGRLMPENNTIGHYYNGENKGKKLAEFLYPNRPIDYIQSLKGPDHSRSSKKVMKEIALIFDIEKGKVISAEMSTIDLHFRLNNNPLYWLELTTEQQSMDKIISLYGSVESIEVKETLVSAAGMHKNAENSFAFLKEVIESDANDDLKEDAVFWIGHIDNPEVVPFLKRTAIEAGSGDVREKAVFSLYNIKSDQAMDAVIMLTREGHSDVRKKAIFWLGQLAGKKALQSLEEIAFSDDETEIQKQAVFALSQLDDGKGIPKLIKIANTHPNPKIRKNAIFWLGESEDERALDALIEMVKK